MLFDKLNILTYFNIKRGVKLSKSCYLYLFIILNKMKGVANIKTEKTSSFILR